MDLAGVEGVLAGRRIQGLRQRPRPFPERPPGTDCLPEIRHIVILMMENHSYDNYLGPLGRGDGLPRDGLGEAFAARIIEAALHGADWMGTLLVWCYDEHGGYYDDVPPPAAVEPDDRLPEAGGAFRYDRYGFRVPAVIVSPYARPDYVSHAVRDHTAILKLIQRKWNLPPLTARDRGADDLLDAIDLTSPPAFATPPDLPPAALAAAASADDAVRRR